MARGDFRLQLDLAVASGEVVGLVGPNGAGKSTALRVLAGLVPMDSGTVVLDGEVIESPAGGIRLPAHRRSVGVVFQDYLLFPHLTALDNVAFGLRSRGTSSRAARQAAVEWLARVDAAELAPARPGELSGGQAQRVALARALATEPALLMLDEPLAALDARTRLLVRGELRRHLAGFGGAVLLVTHDPVDATVLADRLVVLEGGRVVQTGTAAEVARRPRTDYVARLVGLNLLAGHASGHQVVISSGGTVQTGAAMTGPCHVAFRPAAVALFPTRPQGSPRNIWPGRVAGLEPHGDGVRVEVVGAPGPGSSLAAEVTSAAVAELELVPGASVWACVKASEIEVYPAT